MRTIAFVTQKGGAGKSTLATSLAVAALQDGERVIVLDLDPQQSVLSWSRRREAATPLPVEAVAPGGLAVTLREARRTGATLAIVDTPGAQSPACDEAIELADLCIVPVRPNAFDLWASEATLARIKARDGEFAFLLNQCPPARQSARIERSAATLQEMGALLAPLVATRVDYQNAARRGLGVGEIAPTGAAAREMQQLLASLRRRLENLRESTPSVAFIDEALRVQSDFARVACQSMLIEAFKIGSVYAGLAERLFPFPSAELADATAPTEPSEQSPDLDV
jgi:chromosome partitioning protein